MANNWQTKGWGLAESYDRRVSEAREPVKFEAGQVVRVKLPEQPRPETMVITSTFGDYRVNAWVLDERAVFTRALTFGIEPHNRSAEVLSPAPRIGDTWTSGESVARIVDCADRFVEGRAIQQLRIVSEGEPFVGDVVAVARRLWEGGYRRVERAKRDVEDLLDECHMSDSTKAMVRGPATRTATLRDADGALLPGITPIECTPDGERRIARTGKVEFADIASQMARASCDSLAEWRETPDCERVPPRAGDVWRNATTVVELAEGTYGLRTRVITSDERWPAQHIGDVAATLEFLRDHGYRKVVQVPTDRECEQNRREVESESRVAQEWLETMRYVDDQITHATDANGALVLGATVLRQPHVDATTPQSPLDGMRPAGDTLTALARERLSMDRLPNESDEALRARMTRSLWPGMRQAWHRDNAIDRVRDCIEQCIDRGDSVGDVARNIERILDSVRVDRATGDDLRKLAELYGVPELRAGMVVRRETDPAAGVEFGRVARVAGNDIEMLWPRVTAPSVYSGYAVERRLRNGEWRIVTPDVAPLASLAYAVAAIFAPTDLATSRRHIDAAIASLGGEPFARAIAAALVAASDAPLTAHQIASLVAGARAHERRRGEVAPARRELTDGQITACWAAAHYESNGQWSERLSRVYERARAL